VDQVMRHRPYRGTKGLLDRRQRFCASRSKGSPKTPEEVP
jgi:hypothetical protein